MNKSSGSPLLVLETALFGSKPVQRAESPPLVDSGERRRLEDVRNQAMRLMQSMYSTQPCLTPLDALPCCYTADKVDLSVCLVVALTDLCQQVGENLGIQEISAAVPSAYFALLCAVQRLERKKEHPLLPKEMIRRAEEIVASVPPALLRMAMRPPANTCSIDHIADVMLFLVSSRQEIAYAVPANHDRRFADVMQRWGEWSGGDTPKRKRMDRLMQAWRAFTHLIRDESETEIENLCQLGKTYTGDWFRGDGTSSNAEIAFGMDILEDLLTTSHRLLHGGFHVEQTAVRGEPTINGVLSFACTCYLRHLSLDPMFSLFAVIDIMVCATIHEQHLQASEWSRWLGLDDERAAASLMRLAHEIADLLNKDASQRPQVYG